MAQLNTPRGAFSGSPETAPDAFKLPSKSSGSCIGMGTISLGTVDPSTCLQTLLQELSEVASFCDSKQIVEAQAQAQFYSLSQMLQTLYTSTDNLWDKCRLYSHKRSGSKEA